MLLRCGYPALPLGDVDSFPQSNFGFLGSQKGRLFRERGGVGPGADVSHTWSSCLCHSLISFLGFLMLLVTFPISGWFALEIIVPTYDQMIVFLLSWIRTPQEPGMVLLLPIGSFQRVDLRTRAFNVPPCKAPCPRSKNGAMLPVGANVQFRAPVLSVMTVKDLNTAIAQNAMTKALLKRPLQAIQMEKLKISNQLLLESNNVTRARGLEVDHVELAVEAVLQPPQDSPAGPLDSPLQQLALHFLGRGIYSLAGGTLPPGPDILEMVSKVELPPHIGARPSLKQPAEGLLTTLQPHLVSQVRACYQFSVVLPSDTQSVYSLDLTRGATALPTRSFPPRLLVAPALHPGRTTQIAKLPVPRALMSIPLLKVKGNLAMAMKLEAVLRALK
uniref:Stomatin like 1 n=1 Tax=Myotis lucifugus TaxID=59463 RepID=G1PIW5_MYOLU